jgi:hypothetical protein
VTVDSLYSVAFDVGVQGYQTWRYAVTPVVFAIAMTGIAFLPSSSLSRFGRPSPGFYRLVSGLAAIALLAHGVGLLTETRREYNSLSAALRAKHYAVVEGLVADFVPGGPGGHGDETFRVGGVPFRYSAATITSAFHRTKPYGGPIREGLGVRIASVNGAIARPELRE